MAWGSGNAGSDNVGPGSARLLHGTGSGHVGPGGVGPSGVRLLHDEQQGNDAGGKQCEAPFPLPLLSQASPSTAWIQWEGTLWHHQGSSIFLGGLILALKEIYGLQGNSSFL